MFASAALADTAESEDGGADDEDADDNGGDDDFVGFGEAIPFLRGGLERGLGVGAVEFEGFGVAGRGKRMLV